MKYNLHYNNLIKLHGSNNKPVGTYTERHHILPKCLGGSNHPDNLVYLSARAHYIAHLLLRKIYPDNSKILFSAIALSKYGNSKARTYSKLKEEYAAVRRQEGKIQGKPVITPKGRFKSIYAAAEAHKLSRSRLAKKLRSTSFTCKNYYFEGEEKKTKARTGHGLHLAKRVKTPLGVFESCREAAIAHKVCHSVIARRAKNPKREDYQYL